MKHHLLSGSTHQVKKTKSTNGDSTLSNTMIQTWRLYTRHNDYQKKQKKERGSEGMRILPTLMSVRFLVLWTVWGWDSYQCHARWVEEEDEGKKCIAIKTATGNFPLWKCYFCRKMVYIFQKKKTERRSLATEIM